MSIKLMERVWETTLSTAEKMVLLVIADHANANGTNSWPGVETIARKSSMTPRSVQRHIRSMEERGLLVTQRQKGGNENTRGDRRPNRYDIILSVLDGVTIRRPEDNGVTNETARGDNGDITGRQMEQNGVTPMSPYPPLEPSLEPPLEPSAEIAIAEPIVTAEVVDQSDLDFERWWKQYPIKKEKKQAKEQWGKLKPHERTLALEALPEHLAYWEREGTKEKFIPYGIRWLRNRRWEDELVSDYKPAMTLREQAIYAALHDRHTQEHHDDTTGRDQGAGELDWDDEWVG